MRAALPFWACRPTFSDHVAVAGGQKEIDNAYGAPERKRHSHEHDNKDSQFPAWLYFSFFPPASNRYLRSTLIRNISLPRDPAPLLRTLQRRRALFSGLTHARSEPEPSKATRPKQR